MAPKRKEVSGYRNSDVLDTVSPVFVMLSDFFELVCLSTWLLVFSLILCTDPHVFFHLKTFTVGLRLTVLQYTLQWSPPHLDTGR